MKMISRLFFLAIFVLATTSASRSLSDGAGTFRIDGKDYKGGTSVQIFGNKSYSVVCEQKEPYKLLQITFHNQEEADRGGTFNVAKDGLRIASGDVNIGVDGLTFDPAAPATISVKGKVITLTGVKLKETAGGSRSYLIENGKISF